MNCAAETTTATETISSLIGSHFGTYSVLIERGDYIACTVQYVIIRYQQLISAYFRHSYEIIQYLYSIVLCMYTYITLLAYSIFL